MREREGLTGSASEGDGIPTSNFLPTLSPTRRDPMMRVAPCRQEETERDGRTKTYTKSMRLKTLH